MLVLRIRCITFQIPVQFFDDEIFLEKSFLFSDIFTFSDFAPVLAAGCPVFICWVFIGVMSSVASFELQIVNFGIFHPGRWWSVEFYLKMWGSLPITIKINLLRLSN